MLVTGNTSYSYSATNFTYTVTNYNGATVNGSKTVGQVYTVTPQKAGVSNFSIKMNFYKGGSFYTGYQMDYTIYAVDVTSVSIPDMTMTIGESRTYTPVIKDALAVPTLTWHSSNTSIATITNEGVVTAVGVGEATITCTANNGVSGQSIVTVTPIYIESIALNETEYTLNVGEKLQLGTTVQPTNATITEMQWNSTNEDVAVVDQNGLVRAVSSGQCYINATAKDGSEKTASCYITVEKNNKLTVTDMTQCSGGQGVMNVLLSDEETIMGFQFDLQLSTGISVAEDGDGKLLAALTGNAVNTHSISSSKVSDGLYRFVVTPQGSRAISNANGDGMSITIDVADDVTTGTYDMTIKDIEMTVKKAGNVYEDIHPKNSTATLTVTEAMMGDVNGDGRVSVTDVISMNSYILEEEPARFIRKVADLNGDGKVTITDMVQVIDIILGR